MLAPGTRRERVYRALRADLMAGVVSPDDRLSEERLAELYGVSRTPVREALARLVSEGLVERREHGLFPYRPRFEDLGDLYELRATLELRGITRAMSGGITHDRDALGAELDRWRRFRDDPPAPDSGFVALDEQYHLALLAASGNLALCGALDAVNVKVRTVRMFDELTPQRIVRAVDDHIAVAEAVFDGRLDDAHTRLRDHIVNACTAVVQRTEAARTMARLSRAVRD
ncbi:GntR family transcriptional regulator [Rhodococcus zopfii]|uniref:GntR family transcriptional regulator n=1 Tax=Rhodococcus zopfii TaxID=43772 RepID=A0ABU3WKH0_9NOCA|nr:GntR family transcriptional regulator [Rhodococcus zopfii]MDV2474489.1 GntR family transcriptional regulator [Rhodococcus zopfii]